jgi:hypothetical protein
MHAVQNLTQAIQLQAQALQSLQEQQGTIIAAVMPLLPVLQAIPSQLDNAITKATHTLSRKLSPHDASDLPTKLYPPFSANEAANSSSLSGPAPPSIPAAPFDSGTSEIAYLASHSLLTSLKKRTRSPSPVAAEPVVSSSLTPGPVLKKRVRKRSLNGWNLDNAVAPLDCISLLSTSLSPEDISPLQPNRASSPSQARRENVEPGIDHTDADLSLLDSPPLRMQTFAAKSPALSALGAISGCLSNGTSHSGLPALRTATPSIPIIDDSEFVSAFPSISVLMTFDIKRHAVEGRQRIHALGWGLRRRGMTFFIEFISVQWTLYFLFL